MRPLAAFAPRLLLVFGLLLPFAAPAAGEGNRDAAVGADGELYMVRAGSYGDLFPEESLVEPGNPVLALELVHPDQQREVLLIPDTEGADLEDSASVLFEDDSETLFVLWQTKINTIHSRLNLVGFHDGRWTENIEISGSPFGWKSSPQLAITRDRFNAEEHDGAPRTWSRTVVHLIWWEEGATGPRVLYTPVVLIDGEYTGWNPVYRLDDLALAPGAPLAAPNYALAQAPRIEVGANGQTVVIGFVPAAGGELVTVALELLPGEISVLADKVRHQIIDIGLQAGQEGGPSALADKIRHQIIDVGARLMLHPGVSSYVADAVHDRIDHSDPQQPAAALADDIRHQIIDVGAHAIDRGFDRSRMSVESVYRVIELPSDDRIDDTSRGAPADLIRVRRASVRPIPTTGEEKHTLYLSEDGRGVVIAWSEGEALLYRESRGAGWSDVRRLRLDGRLDLPRAKSLLERRSDHRGAAQLE